MNDPAEHEPLREVVASQIRTLIISGELKQGQRLVEGHLAERLGVSRNPVREAIRSLEATGLVEVIPRRGAYVCVIDALEVRQIQELRILLEGYAVIQAAKNRRPEHLAALERCIRLGRQASANGDEVASASHHREFHLLLESAAGNPFLEQVSNPLRQKTELVFSVLVEDRGQITWEEHQAIYEAVALQDHEAAQQRMGHHIEQALNAFDAALEGMSQNN